MGRGQLTPGSSSENDLDCSSSAASQQRAVGVALVLMAHPLNLLLIRTSSSLLEDKTTWLQEEEAKSGIRRLCDSRILSQQIKIPYAKAVGASKK